MRWPPGDVLKVDSAEYTRVSLLGLFGLFSVLLLGAALQISHGFFQPKALAAVTACIVLIAVALALPRVTLLLPFNRRIVLRRSFFVLLVVYLGAGGAFLRIRHLPIDVLIMEDDSARAMLHAVDPYGIGISHRDIYSPEQRIYGPGIEVNGRVKVGFPYPPLTVLWILPGYVLGDVRYSFLLAVALTALMIFYTEPDLNGFVSALIFLFVPDTVFVLTYGWTEPLMLMTLGATIFAARRAPKWLPVALGLFFASKQYSILAVPFVAFLLPKCSWKTYVFLLTKAVAVAAVVTLPFFFWDPRGFWWSLVGFRLVTPLRLDALSFSALLGRHGLPAIPQWFVMLAVLGGIGYALRKAPKSPAGFAISLGLISLIFFVLNIQAFCNYYFFCAGAFCLGVSATTYDLPEKVFEFVELPRSAAQNEQMMFSRSQ
jgi:hypothetical protein